MRKFILSLIFILSVSIQTYSQTITLIPIGTQDVSNIPVSVDHFVTIGNGTTAVKVFRTHYGNGNTSMYGNFANNAADMDKMTSTAYAATTLYWSGNVSALYSLNFASCGTLITGGASVPPGCDYYSVEVTFTFVPKETGTYSFRITSDDGSDLFINGVNVLNYYGGHGMNPLYYANYSVIAGQQYTIRARMQEYGGGDGLIVQWKRPSQSTWNVQTDEIGVASGSWVSQGAKNTNASGQAIWTNSSNWPYRVTVNVSNKFHNITDFSLIYMMFMKGNLGPLQDWDFYTCDCNNSSTFDWDDINFCYTLLTMGSLHNKYVFTDAEKTAIEGNPNVNYYNTYFPTQVRTIENQNRFYIVGTGIHNATQPSNADKLQ